MKPEDLVVGRTYLDLNGVKMVYSGFSKNVPINIAEQFPYEFRCGEITYWRNVVAIEELTDGSHEYYE